MKSKEYWNKRFEQLELRAYKQGSKCFADISKVYDKAILEIEKEIAKWYTRYATENGISLSEAKKILKANELEEFHMTIEEYIALGQSQPWVDELEKASVKFHISRLEAIQTQIHAQVGLLHSNTLEKITDLTQTVYSEQYYKTLFEVQKGFGIGFDVTKLNHRKIAEVLKKPWANDGLNFSSRIWGNRTKLVNALDTTFTQGIITGKNPKKIISEMVHQLDVSRSNVARLVLTENKFAQSKAQQQGFKELGVEQYQISATLDSRTSKICQYMDRKIFKMSEFEVGVTAPPFHPRCRTSTVPYDETDQFFNFERAARDENGKYITVPADMSYPQWKEKFVK